jgi:AcrR family transcriptional regulator
MTPRRAPEAGPLTAEAIVAATEDVLRRYGPAKATVVDVARALNVSHGSVYRHFASKTELREAVARGWLARATAGLADITDGDRPAPERLHDWLRELSAIKRRKVLDEPEMFATYSALIPEDGPVVTDHLANLTGQITRILADGVASGDFRAADPPATARAVLDATARFHDPAHAQEWTSPTIDDEFEAVVALLLAGLA